MIKRKDVLTIAIGCMTVVLAWVLAALLLGWLVLRHVSSAEFDSAEWIEAGNGVFGRTRTTMLEDLESNLESMADEAEVLRLLGKPSWRGKKERTLTYRVGDEPGFISIDSQWLSIRFDDTGELKSWSVWTD